MTLLATEYVTAGGRDLATYANGTEVIEGVDGIPPLRIPRRRTAYMDGAPADYTPLFFEPKLITLRLWIAGTDADGAVTHAAGPLGHIRDNIRAITGIFSKVGAAIPLERTTFDGVGASSVDTLTADARLAGAVSVGGEAMKRRVDVPLELPHPWWLAPTVSRPAASSHTFTPDGDGTVANARLTFAGAGTYVDDHGGDITLTAGTIINVKNRTIGSTVNANNQRNRARFGSGHWARWPGGEEVNITVTGTTVAIAYNPAYN